MSAPAPEDTRFEIKFTSSVINLPLVVQWVRNHWAGFREPFPSRQINNVYFDTYALFAYSENLSGASQRSKVRYRWYGESEIADRGVLEVKRRRGGVGWKLSFPAAGADLTRLSWQAVRRTLRESLSMSGRVWLDANPLSVLINRYRRRYFLSGDGLVRLTVDWDQRAYDQRLSARPNFHRRANMPETLVVELKFARSEQRLAQRMVQGMPLRLSRNSKYVIGVQSMAAD